MVANIPNFHIHKEYVKNNEPFLSCSSFELLTHEGKLHSNRVLYQYPHSYSCPCIYYLRQSIAFLVQILHKFVVNKRRYISQIGKFVSAKKSVKWHRLWNSLFHTSSFVSLLWDHILKGNA